IFERPAFVNDLIAKAGSKSSHREVWVIRRILDECREDANRFWLRKNFVVFAHRITMREFAHNGEILQRRSGQLECRSVLLYDTRGSQGGAFNAFFDQAVMTWLRLGLWKCRLQLLKGAIRL